MTSGPLPLPLPSSRTTSSSPSSPPPSPPPPNPRKDDSEVVQFDFPRDDDPAATGVHPDESSHNLVSHIPTLSQSPVQFAREAAQFVAGTGWQRYDSVIGQPIFYPAFSELMKRDVLATPMLRDRITALADRAVEREAAMGLLPGRPSGDNNARAGKIEGQDSEAKLEEHRRVRELRHRRIVASLESVAEQMADNMICKMNSKRFIRAAYYMSARLLTRAYHEGVHVSSVEVGKLRRVAAEAATTKTPILFLPSHRSHVDYLSLQIICYRLGLALPTVVAGDNLNIAVLGPFLQRAGAMWIRRVFGPDKLYTAVVQAYIDTLLRRGHNLECFIEGGRSRTGKLLAPKFGILSFVLDAVLAGRVPDVLVCPVSTQYDKVVEVDSYVRELLGVPKRQESVADLLSASSVLSLRLGRIDVRFGDAWSLRDFVMAEVAKRSLAQGIAGPDPVIGTAAGQIAPITVNTPGRTRILRTLGYKVLSEINAASIVMPTALIGTALLTVRKRGVGHAELVARVKWLVDRVRARGGRVGHVDGQDIEAVVVHSLGVLGPDLVGRSSSSASSSSSSSAPSASAPAEAELEVTYYPVDRFQLSFYRNMTIHLFLQDAIVCAALSTRVRLGGGPGVQRMPMPELRAYVAFLSRLFRTEFVFPVGGLDRNLDAAVGGLVKDGVVEVWRSSGESGGPTRGGPDDDTGPIESVALSETERLRGREHFDFYCALIWPFVEAAWLGAVSLLAIVGLSRDDLPEEGAAAAPAEAEAEAEAEGSRGGAPGRSTPPTAPPPSGAVWIPLGLAVDTARTLGKTLYHQGELSFFESVNEEILKNTYQRFVAEGVLDVRMAEVGRASRGRRRRLSQRAQSRSRSRSDSRPDSAGGPSPTPGPDAAPDPEIKKTKPVQVIRLADAWAPRPGEDVATALVWALADRIAMARQPSGSVAGWLGREEVVSFLAGGGGSEHVNGTGTGTGSGGPTGFSPNGKNGTTTTTAAASASAAAGRAYVEPLLPPGTAALTGPSGLVRALVRRARDRLVLGAVWIGDGPAGGLAAGVSAGGPGTPGAPGAGRGAEKARI